MPDYSLGKIYRIVCNTTGKVYYGSTTQKYLSKRLAAHCRNLGQYLEGKTNYTSSFEVLENQNYECVLVENYPCNTKDELHSRERFYIEGNKCVNIKIPTRTDIEYWRDNPDKKKEKDKRYYMKHKEDISAKEKERYKENKVVKLERAKQYYESNKDKVKQYGKQWRDEHREEKRERDRLYREQHKDDLNRRRREANALRKQQA
jgi:hypothetical protein